MQRAIKDEISKRMPDRENVSRESLRYLRAHDFIKHLYKCKSHMTRQELLTLRGQALKGDIDGAMRGLGTIMDRR